MKKIVFILILLYSSASVVYSQSSKKKTMFILDSVVVANQPQCWNAIQPNEISDITVTKDKDVLKRLGKSDYGEVILIFTKAYRNRSENLKRTHDDKQMPIKGAM